MAQVEDRLLAGVPNAPTLASATSATMLADVFAARGLTVPADLISPVGAGATTLWKLNAAQTLVVSNTSREAAIDDAFECGRIAATAALSAVHATAARPLFARLTCACPAGATDAARRALIEGVAVAMSDAGAVLTEAEVVDASVLRFDVLVAGTVRPDRIRSVAGAQPDDVLVLGSALGIGIYAAANAKGRLTEDERRTLIEHATRAQGVGVALGTIKNAHAVTTVGPGGLLGAALALAEAAALPVALVATRVPVLPRALALAKAGALAPESSRNWNRDGARVALADRVMPEMRGLLTDPHPSGALLVACKADSVERILRLFADAGETAAAIGSFASLRVDATTSGNPRLVTVEG
jgi:selenide, water dikinase